MNSKELLTAVIEGKSVNQVPVIYIDCGTWNLWKNNCSMNELLETSDRGVSLLRKFNDKFNFDIVWAAPATYNYAAGALGGIVKGDIKGVAPELKGAFIDLEKGIPSWSYEYIKEKLASDKYISYAIEQTKGLKELYRGKKHLAINFVGPMTLASQYVGISDFCIMLFDGDEKLEALLDLCTNVCKAFYQLFTEAGCDFIFIGDPTSSGDLINSDLFEEYAVPSIKRLCNEIRGFADIILLHICGKVKDRISLLKGSGIDAFSFDALDFDTAKAESGDDFALFGNITPVSVLYEKSEKEAYRICLEAASSAKKTGRTVLCPGCDIAPGTSEENIMAMVRAARKA